MSPRDVRSGAVAVEFALVVPLLLILLAGVIEWGWFLSREVLLLEATREAALAGVLTRLEEDPAVAAQQRLAAALAGAGLDPAGLDSSAEVIAAPTGCVITVRASLPYASLVRLVPIPARLGADVTMRLQDQDR